VQSVGCSHGKTAQNQLLTDRLEVWLCFAGMCACQCFTCASREVLRKSARLAYSFLFTLAMLLAWVSFVSVTALDALSGSGQADLSKLLGAVDRAWRV